MPASVTHLRGFACAGSVEVSGLIERAQFTNGRTPLTPRATPWGRYRDIAETLRQRLGDLPAGSAVPSEASLVAEYGVARNTVRRALAELDSEGLMETLPGRGRVVRTHGGTAISGILPAYQRIADDLRRDIESGKLAQDARVPSEAVLRERYGVSRGTARQALRILEADGLVGAVHGKGRFVQTARRGHSVRSKS